MSNKFLQNLARGFFFKKNEYKSFGKCSIILKPGNVSNERNSVPDHIKKPPYYETLNRPSSTYGSAEIKNLEQIARMRDSCKLAANILKRCDNIVKVGLTTDQIDEFVYNACIENNAYPSPLRYCGFPKSVCTSVNNVACHGIPDDRKLEDGDIINIDVTVFLNGFHGDCSKMFLVGNVDEKGRYLVHHNERALEEAIKICKPDQPFNEIGKVISEYAQKVKLTTIPAFIGHGIGSYFHGPPEIYHFENDYDIGCMKPGMTFTIEPIFSIGTDNIEICEDGWTALTTDFARTAQVEHTILITDEGCEALTIPD